MNLSTDDESSQSTSDECLVTPGKLNLNSSFFQLSASKPSCSRVKDDDSSEFDDDFTSDNNKKVESATLLAEVMKNLENAMKAEEMLKTPLADSKKESPTKDKKNVLCDEITNLLLQGETGASSVSFEDDQEDTDESQGVKPTTEYTIPKEGVKITLPNTGMMMISRRKKRGQDLEEILRKKMNQRLRLNQVLIHKVGLLCWLAHGFHLNCEINDSEVLSTSLLLIPTSSYPKGRVDLKYLEQFTKWFKNLFKLEFKDIAEGVRKDTLLVRLREKKVCNYRELVLLYAATLRSMGLNCRLVVSLSPPARQLQRHQLFQNSNEEPKSEKTSISIPKKESAKRGKKVETVSRLGKRKRSPELSSGKIVPENSSELGKKAKSDAKKRAADVLSKFASVPDRKCMRPMQISNAEPKTPSASPEKNKDDAKSPPRTRQLRSRVVAQNFQPSAVGKSTKKVTFVEKKEKEEKSTVKRSRAMRAAEASTSTKVDSGSDEEIKAVSLAKKKATPENVVTIAGTMTDSEGELESKSMTKKMKINPKGIESNAGSENESEEDFEPKSIKKRNIYTSKTVNKAKLPTHKEISASKNIETDAASESDSDEEFERRAPVKKKKNQTQKKETRAKTERRDSIDRRVLSSDEELAEIVDARGAQNIWVEVYVESEESWISVSVPDDKIHCVSDIYRKAPKPVFYVIAWNSVGTVKDVTRRYCPHWLTVTRKQRIDENWWVETLNPWKEKNTVISRAEDEMLLQRELEQPLPKTVGECKGHPLYALARHLLKFEAIYPPESVPVGHLKTGDAIYSRYCVHTLCSRETWIKKARVVKPAQEPYKIVKAMPKYDKLSGTVMKDLPLDLFGKWQTTQYIPPVAKDGIVPRNEYGNVDLFKECMLPIGTVHINLPALNRVARKLNIDCVPAIVGFNFGARGAIPATEGYVVCAEFEDTLREAWHADQIEAAKRARDKRAKRVYGNWKKLIKGLFIRERLAARYDFNEEDDNNSELDKKKPSTSTKSRPKRKAPEAKQANDRKAKKS